MNSAECRIRDWGQKGDREESIDDNSMINTNEYAASPYIFVTLLGGLEN